MWVWVFEACDRVTAIRLLRDVWLVRFERCIREIAGLRKAGMAKQSEDYSGRWSGEFAGALFWCGTMERGGKLFH